MLSLQVLDLAGTNPVLAGAGSAACECVGDYLLVHRLCPLYIGSILCIHREEGVVVAVAYMSQDRPVQTASLYGFAGMPQGSRQIGDRDAYIGSHHAFIGKEAVYREGSLVACLPELLPSGFVFLKIESRTILLVAELAGFLNVACYAGVVMDHCGLPRDLFTPTFASSRVIGWCANILEQAAHNRIVRPLARYVGPPPPQPVPSL